jgi:hypothetical protein
MSSNTVIKLKKSGVSGNSPTSLNYGELALNWADGKLWYQNGTGIKAIYNQKTFSTINSNNTLILAGSYTDTLSIIAGNNITISTDAINKSITINSSGSGSGSSTLAGLTDVQVPNANNSDLLVYNASLSKWVNRPPSGGYTHSTLTFFPAYYYGYGENNQNLEDYVGQLGPTVDAFGVSLSTNFDCMDPVGSLQTEDLGALS